MNEKQDPAYPPPPPPAYTAADPHVQQPTGSYPAQQQPYQQPYTHNHPGMSQQGQTVIITSTGPSYVMQYSDVPMNMQCPHCSTNIVTRTEKKIGMMVWLVAGVLILLGLWLFCCLIPFCIPALYDVVHYCPNCNRQLGVKQRLS